MTAPEDQSAPETQAELPSYALEEEERGGWRVWLRGKRLAVVCATLVVTATVLIGAKPLYREIKARRALAIAAQAGEALDRGEAAEASRLLRQSALMAFQDDRVAALVTLHAARAGDMASVNDIGKKLSLGNATPEETLVYGEMSLLAGHVADASKAADALTGVLPSAQNARAIALRSGILQSQGRANDAADVLRAGLAANTGEDSDGLRIGLARLLLGEKTPNSAKEAEELLEQAARNQGKEGAAALRLLCASRSGLTPEARRNLERTAERLRAHPNSTDEDEIFLSQLALNADPSRATEVAASLVKALRDDRAAAIDTRVAAARWLVGHGRHREALDLIGEEEATHHAGALMIRLDALSGLEDWDKTSDLIEKTHGGALPDTLYHLFRARMATVRGDGATAENEKRQLRQVMSFAEAPHVLFAARYAEAVEWKPEALAAWRILMADENARPEAIRGQLRNLPSNAPAAEGLALTSELLALNPSDPSARVSDAYFRLLANQDIDQSAALAEEFLAGNPESPDLQRVAALARLRTGAPDRGLSIWPGDGQENRWRALHVALLQASGQTRAAKSAAEEIDEDALGPEEKDLLSGQTEDAPDAEDEKTVP